MLDAMPPHPAGYVCHLAEAPPEIDGRLDDPAWQAAPWSVDFRDIEGDARPRPRLRTRVRMLWDDTHFYVAAELEEPHVWGTITQRDAVIFQDNDFEVFIDPDGDNHLYYELEINALNTAWDLLLVKPYKNGGPPVNGWDIAGLRSAVHVDGTPNDPSDVDRGWSLEIALPWKALRECAGRDAPPRVGDQWRVNFSRVEWLHEIADGKYRKVPKRPEDNWVWSPQGVIDMHRPWTWGYVQFGGPANAPAAFRPDPLHATRMALVAVYSAQRARLEAGEPPANDLKALELAPWALAALGDGCRIAACDERFEAAVEVERPGSTRLRVTIREDGRLAVIDPNASDDSKRE